jgi:hypothetical protein
MRQILIECRVRQDLVTTLGQVNIKSYFQKAGDQLEPEGTAKPYGWFKETRSSK